MKSVQAIQQQVDAFNETYKVGDAIRLKTDSGDIVRDEIKHPATIMGGHSPVAWLKKYGSYRLDRVVGHAHALVLSAVSGDAQAGKPYMGTISNAVNHLEGQRLDEMIVLATLTKKEEFDSLIELLQVHKRCFVV